MKKVAANKSSSPAATKVDIRALQAVIKSDFAQVAMKSDLEKFALKSDLAKLALKTDLLKLELAMKSDLAKLKTELFDQMLFLNEQQLSNFCDIFADRTSQQNDRIDDHEHRLRRVEHKVGMAV